MKIVKVCLAMTFALGMVVTLQSNASGQQLKNLHKTSNVYLFQQEVKGIKHYESELSVKATVPVPTFEDTLVVELVDMYLGGGLSKLATQFHLDELEIVTVAQIACPPELSRAALEQHGIRRSWVNPRPSPLAVMVGMVLAGNTDTAIHELLPALIDQKDAQMLKNLEAEMALLRIRDWCWTNLPVPPFPFPGR